MIADMHLPGMDGLALARAIRADPALAATRLVLASGSFPLTDEHAARAAGFDACVSKPVRQAEWQDILRRLLGAVVGADSTAPNE